MFFHIKASAKDEKSLKAFSQFMLKLNFTSNLVKTVPKQNARKFVTVLKSPHVNKTAQEQFEFRLYTKEFIVDSFKPLTFFLVLKKINSLSFSGINLKVKSLLTKNKKKKLLAVNPDNLDLNTVRSYDSNQSKLLRKSFLSSKRYIQLFDCYGEISLKEDFY